MFGKKKCIVCDKDIEKNGDYTSYKMRRHVGKVIGKFDIHADLDCFMEGSRILRRQIDSSYSHGYTEVSGCIRGMNYSFKLLRNKNGFEFVTHKTDQRGRDTPDKTNQQFFEFCKYSKHVTLAWMLKFKDTPEYHIPRMISIKDPMINQEFLKGDEYQKIVSDAEHEYKLSVKIKGEDTVEGLIALGRYVMTTSLIV